MYSKKKKSKSNTRDVLHIFFLNNNRNVFTEEKVVDVRSGELRGRYISQ